MFQNKKIILETPSFSAHHPKTSTLNLSPIITQKSSKGVKLYARWLILECLQAYGLIVMTVSIEWKCNLIKQERVWGSDMIIVWSIFLKSCLFFDSIFVCKRIHDRNDHRNVDYDGWLDWLCWFEINCWDSAKFSDWYRYSLRTRKSSSLGLWWLHVITVF